MKEATMIDADTPMPGEDPGALIEDPSRLDELETAPETEKTVPEDDDPKVRETEVQPT
jgi:hypothetical protein